MPYYVPLDEFARHHAEIKDGDIVGCRGCSWTPSSYRPTSSLFQYVQHISKYKAPGELVLSDFDAKLLQEMNISADE